MANEQLKKKAAEDLAILGWSSREIALVITRERGEHARKYRSYARDEKLSSMYRAGKTLAEIGYEFGITRERVRQILVRVGVTKGMGGIAKRSRNGTALKEKLRKERRDARCLSVYGCDYAAAIEINGGASLREPRTPAAMYFAQMRFAEQRKIGWKLTLPQWWKIWSDSGHFAQRGRARDAYCMSRFGDTGCYEVGNVKICTNLDNIREGRAKKQMTVSDKNHEVLAWHAYYLRRQGLASWEIASRLNTTTKRVLQLVCYAKRWQREGLTAPKEYSDDGIQRSV